MTSEPLPAVARRPITVAAVNDYDLVVDGLAALLGHFRDDLVVVDRIIIGEHIEHHIDVALYDTYGREGVAEEPLRSLIEEPNVAHVAVFTLDLRPGLVAAALAAGASGVIAKTLSGRDIADAVLRIAAGETVQAHGPARRSANGALDWPGRREGLSQRESEVLVLCAEGLSNREIGLALYVSPETIKTHLRHVFAKLGLRNRVQAATFVQKTGTFAPRVAPAPIDPPTSLDPAPRIG